MLSVIKRVWTLFAPFRKPLTGIALLIMVQKIGDLMVPFFAGQVIDAMAQRHALDAIYSLVAASFIFWIGHGNILPYLLGRIELKRFRYTAPQHIGVANVGTVVNGAGTRTLTRDTAFQQAVIERGEQVLMDFMNSLVRVAIPISLPGIVILGLLLWWYPLVGLIALVGGTLDVLVTVWQNKVLAPRYAQLQGLDYQRQRLLTQIFRDLPAIVAGRRQKDVVADYAGTFGEYAAFGKVTGLQFLGFNFGRGIIVNITNLMTWVVGAWYVDAGVYSLGYFLASLSWSTYVLNVVGSGIELQKQWMETMPAIKAIFTELDTYDAGAARPPVSPVRVLTPEITGDEAEAALEPALAD